MLLQIVGLSAIYFIISFGFLCFLFAPSIWDRFGFVLGSFWVRFGFVWVCFVLVWFGLVLGLFRKTFLRGLSCNPPTGAPGQRLLEKSRTQRPPETVNKTHGLE